METKTIRNWKRIIGILLIAINIIIVEMLVHIGAPGDEVVGLFTMIIILGINIPLIILGNVLILKDLYRRKSKNRKIISFFLPLSLIYVILGVFFQGLIPSPLYYLATNTGNEFICSILPMASPDIRGSCYLKVAISKKDLTICEKIDNLSYRYNCNMELAEIKKDESICATKFDQFAANDCYHQLAKIKKDSSLCNRITNENHRQECYNDVYNDVMENWKTYRNDEYGFEIKYPSEWKTVSEFSGRLGPGQTEFIEGINPQSFIFAPNSKDLTKNEADVIFYVAPEGYFNCSGYTNLSNDNVNDFLKQNIAKDEIEFCKSNIYFRFSTTTLQKEIFDQMLSTFNFLETSAQEQACIDSGGTLTTASCCQVANDFPSSCLIGACGCSPTNSHQVETCDCGNNKCFDGTKCISKEATSVKSMITVISPNGGEKLVKGNTYNITWNTSPSFNSDYSQVSINLVAGNRDQAVIPFRTIITKNTGSYKWTVPDVPLSAYIQDYPAGPYTLKSVDNQSQFRFLIEGYPPKSMRAEGPFDYSDSYFSIVVP
jgi:hypothetical protein